MIKYLNVSVFSPDYENESQRFLKKKGHSKVHPFYGLREGSEVGFESKVSVERNFQSVSPKPQSGEIKVLVLGGSVASHLSIPMEDIVKSFSLSRRLNDRFNTDRFVVYNAGFGGGKQPQQYFKFVYFDLLGFKPDLIINYDGFNEVALPFAENLERNLNAIYPRSFDRAIVSTNSDGSCIKLNNWLLSGNSYIPFFELIKWVYVRNCHNQLTGKEVDLGLSSKGTFMMEEQNYLDRVINIWAMSSNKLADLAAKNGILYVHVVQPNQYLAGSKPLSEIEITKFYDFESIKKPIQSHYNLLDIDTLEFKLKLDQRWLFKEETRTVYSDNCCHFNQLGMNMIIEDLIDNFEPTFLSLLSYN